MDLYTLTDQFLDKDVIDEYVSAIWTERYFEAGEVQLVVPATAQNIERLADGTFLALRGTKEVMLLETHSIEEKLLTVVGKSLLKFLENRLIWFKNPNWHADNSPARIVDYSEVNTVGEFLANVVDLMVINPTMIPGAGWAATQLDWEYDKIPNLELGYVDTSGEEKRLTIPTGSLYDGIAQLARQEEIGVSLYLDYAHPDSGYLLKFTTYRGEDHTSDGSYPLVRLTPDLETIGGLKEVRSRANYKNVCYVWYKNEVSIHYEHPELPKPEGFERRVLVTDAEGEPVGRKVVLGGAGPWGSGGWTKYVVGDGEVAAFREQNARDSLANHNYVLAVDGETSPMGVYKYGVDYSLGSLVELEGTTGIISKARVTEYIRAEDKSGEREYPTISVLGDDE